MRGGQELKGTETAFGNLNDEERRVAIGDLHALYSKRLYRTIFSITRNSEDAEDVLQETFLRAYEALNQFEGRSGLYSWLTRIAINSALMILRKRRCRAETQFEPYADASTEPFSFEIKDSAPTPEESYELHEFQVRIQRAIRRLRPGLRETILMNITREASVLEISRALAISPAAAKSRLFRARLHLSSACRASRRGKPYFEAAAARQLASV